MSDEVLLVTGSRFYPTNRISVVRRVLIPYARRGVVLRVGACPPIRDGFGHEVAGFDWMAQTIWEKEGLECDLMPADWERDGKVGGPIRNKAMVNKKPVAAECIGFPWFEGRAKSWGTIGCMNLADSAGIPTTIASSDGSTEPYDPAAFRKKLSGMWK